MVKNPSFGIKKLPWTAYYWLSRLQMANEWLSRRWAPWEPLNQTMTELWIVDQNWIER